MNKILSNHKTIPQQHQICKNGTVNQRGYYCFGPDGEKKWVPEEKPPPRRPPKPKYPSAEEFAKQHDLLNQPKEKQDKLWNEWYAMGQELTMREEVANLFFLTKNHVGKMFDLLRKRKKKKQL